MTSRLMNLKNEIQENQKGLLSIFGAFLLQLCVGSYYGTFGNLLPYIASYLRQVNICKHNSSEYYDGRPDLFVPPSVIASFLPSMYVS